MNVVCHVTAAGGGDEAGGLELFPAGPMSSLCAQGTWSGEGRGASHLQPPGSDAVPRGHQGEEELGEGSGKGFGWSV